MTFGVFIVTLRVVGSSAFGKAGLFVFGGVDFLGSSEDDEAMNDDPIAPGLVFIGEDVLAALGFEGILCRFLSSLVLDFV